MRYHTHAKISQTSYARMSNLSKLQFVVFCDIGWNSGITRLIILLAMLKLFEEKKKIFGVYVGLMLSYTTNDMIS